MEGKESRHKIYDFLRHRKVSASIVPTFPSALRFSVGKSHPDAVTRSCDHIDELQDTCQSSYRHVGICVVTYPDDRIHVQDVRQTIEAASNVTNQSLTSPLACRSKLGSVVTFRISLDLSSDILNGCVDFL